MSVLIHRCERCSHDGTWHNVGQSGGRCSNWGCDCLSMTGGAEPEVIPTFLRAGRGVQDRFLTPGSRDGVNGIRPCRCPRCRELFAELAG